jgi:hypothetical protein
MVTDGHLTNVPVDSIYSGVLSLQGLQAVVFLSELNVLKVWAGNVYLEVKNS